MRKYKKTSKLVNNTGYTPGYASESNPVNYIPSQNITMENTPYPVYGQPLDQFGNPIANPTYMEPGMNYNYGNDAAYVAETPAYKDGGMKQDWISEKIGELVREGRPQKQAIAIAYSMWEQKHEMGGTQLPMMQDAGTWYKNNPPVFVEGFGTPEYLASQEGQATNTNTPNKFNFKANPQIGGPLNLNTKAEPWKYGLGQDPNYVNPLSTESLTAGKDWAAKNPLPAGVKQPMATSIGFEPMTAAELSKGVQNAKVTNDGGAAARATTGITQFYNPYGGIGMGDALEFSGEQFAKGNTGLGIVGAASGALQGAKAFLSGMSGQTRQKQVMQTYAEDQRRDMTGEDNPTTMAYGGYYQNGGKDKSDYEDEINAEMDKSYPEVTVQNNPVFGNQNMEAPVVAEEKSSANFDPNSARDNWVQKTGLPWSEAKRLGYTSGTAKDNIKLLSELKDPRFKAENLRKAPVTRKKEDNTIYNGGELKEVIVSRKSPKKKSNYVDPYKGLYEDEEGDIRNSKGIMVGLDGQPLNWFERNFSDQGVIPPMDSRGVRMKKPSYGSSIEENNAWSKARYDNQKAREAQELRAAQLKRKQIEDTWGTPKYGQFQLFQEGGMQAPMEEGQSEAPQQAGGEQMQAIAQEVAAMLQQGADPQEILQQLVQAGLPEEQAMQVIQMVMEQMQGAQPQATPQLGRGGEMMDEQMEGENEMVEGETPNQEGIERQVEQALKQGADPQEILQQLVQMGMPEQEAIQMIQEIMQEIQGGETEQEAPEEGQPMMKNGGEYLEALKGKKIKNYTYNKNTGNYDVELE